MVMQEDMPRPKPRRKADSGNTIETLGTYEMPNPEVYHGYEDIHLKDMLSAGDGLYEDPEVVVRI